MTATEKTSLLLQTPKEAREDFKKIAEHSVISHCYILPNGYNISDIVKDLLALSIATGKINQRGPKDPPLKFNAEKQTFWLCQHFIEQNKEGYSVEQSDRQDLP
jgi:hypothetical protein